MENNDKNNPETQEEKTSYVTGFYKRHKTDIAIYILALSILVGFALHGAIIADKNKKSEIHYRYYDSSEEDDHVVEIIEDDTIGTRSERGTVSLKLKETGTKTSSSKKTTTKKTTTKRTTTPKTSSSKKEKTTTEEHHTVFPVDINLVTYEQLLEIRGVGEVMANDILSYRVMVGVIHDMRELLQISGIGESRLAMLMQYLYVSEADYIPFDDNSSSDTATTVITQRPPDPEPEPDITSETEQPPEEPHFEYVHINTADAEELMRCLLITQEQADAIIALREQIGYFSSPEELILTDAFSAAEIEAFRDYLLFDRDY